MRVPIHLALLRKLIGLPLVLSAALAFAARGPQPDLRIPLDSVGFQPLTQDFLLRGSSMLTLGFVDDHHLLVTFEIHALLKRIPNDPPTDQDRVIRAVLVELPSGRALAHADWRLHDRGQYLWNLGQGQFLLRIRDTLTTFAPLAGLNSGNAFGQQPFLDVVNRHIGALQLTPEADVLTVETKAIEPSEKPVSDAAGPVVPDPAPDTSDTPIQVNFYRIENTGSSVRALYAGVGRARSFGSFAITNAGYLQVLDQGHMHWAFNFDTFSGKVWELSPFDSTCRPSPIFVSHSEFIAFGCHGADSAQIFGGFNMRGEQTWQQGLYGSFIDPYLAFSPASGRFALSRILTTSPLADTTPLIPETLSSQTVVVYQAGSGRQILKVECSPIEPAGQNLALSPDGLRLGVVHDGAIEIYQLPSLTAKEQADLKLAQSSSPKPVELPVRFAASGAVQPTSGEVKDEPAAQPPAPAAASATPSTPAPATKAAAATPATNPAPQAQPPAAQPAPAAENASGDQQPGHRKPPTLYTLPTDPPHNQSQEK
ncbi:hypothetical protein [Edaphobacter sp.]|uniref:hypothetical protein n=1 Tax=Edaphobacter sp. TaxID=1934404 RepID=UPI002DB5596C|nr:hypothetical protein [Edaphobacter sp.]HEU5341445.1 hypothetical protein [Edaphobacter sp.]